ncbi:hypothetical protein LINPERPRIM_LOCUS3389 [Linum perenne]
MKSSAKSTLRCSPLLSTCMEMEALAASGSSSSVQAVQSYVKESTQKIEKVETGRSVTYRVIDGDLCNMYDPYRVTFSFLPSPKQNNHKCIAQWQAEFEPISPSTPLPEQARDAALAFLKSFDTFNCSANQ